MSNDEAIPLVPVPSMQQAKAKFIFALPPFALDRFARLAGSLNRYFSGPSQGEIVCTHAAPTGQEQGYVLLVRDPRDQGESLRDTLLWMDGWLRHLDRKHSLIVRFEDLARQPFPVLSEICRFVFREEIPLCLLEEVDLLIRSLETETGKIGSSKNFAQAVAAAESSLGEDSPVFSFYPEIRQDRKARSSAVFRGNTIIKTHHGESLAEEFGYLDAIGYGDLNYEALWKWAAVIRSAKDAGIENKSHPLNMVAIGDGMSPLQYHFSNFGVVQNVEMWVQGKRQSWFPVNEKGFYVKSKGIPHKPENIRLVHADFLEWVSALPPNSVDLFFDGCSFIHVRRDNPEAIPLVMQHIEAALKPGGHFISASDAAHPSKPEVKEFVHPGTLAARFASGRLKFTTTPDLDLEPFFQDPANAHQSTPGVNGAGLDSACTPYKETRKRCMPPCRHLPDFHLLYTGTFREITSLVRCVFTLVKD